ncbi:MAG: hypothetical protein U1F20_03595 [Lysobacterales bacterium]
MSRIPTLLVLAALASSACSPLDARPLVDIDVIDRDTGQWLPEAHARGSDWIPGDSGHRYSVRLTNTSGERVLVVLSVDGVNAVTGETAAPSQAGYVLAPWQSTEIAGWRKSLDDVAQFYFTDLPDSYAARTGRPDNVGVIGIAVFRERPRPIVCRCHSRAPIANEQRAMDKAAAPSAARESASAADAYGGMQPQRIGTGHGAREWCLRSGRPRSNARLRALRKSPSCATTTATRWWRWASSRAMDGATPATTRRAPSRTASSPIRRTGDAALCRRPPCEGPAMPALRPSAHSALPRRA